MLLDPDDYTYVVSQDITLTPDNKCRLQIIMDKNVRVHHLERVPGTTDRYQNDHLKGFIVDALTLRSR